MNWEKLRMDNPKAWDKFTSWNFITGSKYVKSPFDFLAQEFNWQKGILYDFFDSNGIMVSISPYLKTSRTVVYKFAYYIEEITILDIDTEFIFDSRKQAEEAAFTKAFEILNNKLNQ